MEKELLLENIDLNRNELGQIFLLANVVVRYIIYFFISIIILLLLIFAITEGVKGDTLIDTLIRIIGIITPFTLVGFIEWNVLKFRKKYGFSKWGGIWAEYKRRVIEDKAIMKSNAINRNVKTSQTEKGLDYWFDLKQKGAISEEEYEKKKQELL